MLTLIIYLLGQKKNEVIHDVLFFYKNGCEGLLYKGLNQKNIQ